MTIVQLFNYLPLASVGIAAITGVTTLRQQSLIATRQLTVLWTVNFTLDLTGNLMKLYNINNHWLYNILFWLMFYSLPFCYKSLLHQPLARNAINLFHVVFPVMVLLESCLRGIAQLQSGTIVLGSLFMIFLAASYCLQLYQSDDSTQITRDPWFWFSFGFLIHFGGTMPFLGMLNYLWQHYPSFTNFYYSFFSNSFTILLNLLITAGFLCRRLSHSRK